MNVLADAFDLIPPQLVRFAPPGVQAQNDELQTYTTPVESIDVLGRIIPLTTRMYTQMGLDFKKRYFNFLSLEDLASLTRSNVSAGTFNFKGETYQLQTRSDDFKVLNWDRYLCVIVKFIPEFIPPP